MRACRMPSCQSTIMSAPFSLGSQPQKRPQLSLAQMPPRMVPTTEKIRPKQMHAVGHRLRLL